MTRLSWDSFVEERMYEIGVDRAIVAPTEDTPISWSGIISVEERSDLSEIFPVYQNGVRIHNYTYAMSFEASVTAFTYPEELDDILDEMPQPAFSMSYRTDISEKGYKLHLLYNCNAFPSGVDYETMSASPDPVIFGWDFISRPRLDYDGLATGSHFIIDSTFADPDALSQIEDILYGTDSNDPRFITPFEVRFLLGGMPPQEIVPDYETGLSEIIETITHKDLVGNRGIGLYRKTYESRLVNRDLPPGFFRLE